MASVWRDRAWATSILPTAIATRSVSATPISRRWSRRCGTSAILDTFRARFYPCRTATPRRNKPWPASKNGLAEPVTSDPNLEPVLRQNLIHPEILAVLARAGHHAKILIADGNYPVSTKRGLNSQLVCLNLSPGVVTVGQVLRAVLSAVPVDHLNT